LKECTSCTTQKSKSDFSNHQWDELIGRCNGCILEEAKVKNAEVTHKVCAQCNMKTAKDGYYKKQWNIDGLCKLCEDAAVQQRRNTGRDETKKNCLTCSESKERDSFTKRYWNTEKLPRECIACTTAANELAAANAKAAKAVLQQKRIDEIRAIKAAEKEKKAAEKAANPPTKECFNCRMPQEKGAFTKRQWVVENERVCLTCTAAMDLLAASNNKRECSICSLPRERSKFSKRQWNSMARTCVDCAEKRKADAIAAAAAAPKPTKECSICLAMKERDQFSASKWKIKGRTVCLECTVGEEEKVIKTRVCCACSQERLRTAFSDAQWRKKEDTSKCLDCVAADKAKEGGEKTAKTCIVCLLELEKTAFSANQWTIKKNGDASPTCSNCIAKQRIEMMNKLNDKTKACTACGEHLPKAAFSQSQWSLGASKLKCLNCVAIVVVKDDREGEKECAFCAVKFDRTGFAKKKWNVEGAKCLNCVAVDVQILQEDRKRKDSLPLDQQVAQPLKASRT